LNFVPAGPAYPSPDSDVSIRFNGIDARLSDERGECKTDEFKVRKRRRRTNG